MLANFRVIRSIVRSSPLRRTLGFIFTLKQVFAWVSSQQTSLLLLLDLGRKNRVLVDALPATNNYFLDSDEGMKALKRVAVTVNISELK